MPPAATTPRNHLRRDSGIRRLRSVDRTRERAGRREWRTRATVPRRDAASAGTTADDRVEADRQTFGAERRNDVRVDAPRREQRRNAMDVDEDVVVPFVVAAPGTVAGPNEGCDRADEAVARGRREARHDRPVVGDPAEVRGIAALLAVLVVAEIDRQDPARSERVRDRDESALDRLGVRQVVERMADRDDRVGGRDRVVRQDETLNRLGVTGRAPGELEHRVRRVGRDDPVPAIEQVPREQSAPAAELDDESIPLSDGREQRQDARRAVVRVEGEPAIVDESEIAPVIRFRSHDARHHRRRRASAACPPCQPSGIAPSIWLLTSQVAERSVPCCPLQTSNAPGSPKNASPNRESLPFPPSRVSLPKFPVSESLPSPPLTVSLPGPPKRSSFPTPPSTVSRPVWPVAKSLPAPPRRTSLPASPASWSSPAPPLITSLPPGAFIPAGLPSRNESPVSPSRMSFPVTPSIRSSPRPPQIRSSPPRPKITSSPPSPAMTSGPSVPRITSAPSVPTIVAGTSTTAPWPAGMGHVTVDCAETADGAARPSSNRGTANTSRRITKKPHCPIWKPDWRATPMSAAVSAMIESASRLVKWRDRRPADGDRLPAPPPCGHHPRPPPHADEVAGGGPRPPPRH